MPKQRKETHEEPRGLEMTETNTLDAAEVEQTVCDGCRLIPLSRLSLDLDEPVVGWDQYVRGEGINVMVDDVGEAGD